MTPQDAAELATRISQTWRGGPATHVWEEELENLDAGRAGTTYAKLRREAEHAPTIARFHALYRTTGQPEAPESCHRCDGTGWERARDHVAQDRHGDEIRYAQVAPCRHCRNGERMQPVYATLAAANRGDT